MEPKKIVKRRLISFSNYSTCVTLPKKSLEQLGWHKGDSLAIEVDLANHRMILTTSKQQSTTSAPAAIPEAAIEPLPSQAAQPASPITTDTVSEQLRW